MKIPEFIHAQLCVTPPIPSASLAGQTVIITGGNRGLGFESAKHVVRLGASHLILGVRTIARGVTAKDEILAANPGAKTIIEVWPIDLCNYASVVEFGARAQGLERIDAVLHNAGIMTSIYRPAEDNEMTITVTVSTFLLSLLLLPKLRESAKTFNIVPRNTIVGSEVHNWVSFKERFSAQGEILADMNDQSKARMKDRYFASKLIVMFCVRELADLIDAKNKNDSGRGDVIVNCPAPGFVATELEQDNPEALSYRVLEKVLARTPEVGSRCLVDGLVRGKESHGAYLSECVVKDPSKFVLSVEGKQTQKRVWDEIMAKMEKVQPGIETKI